MSFRSRSFPSVGSLLALLLTGAACSSSAPPSVLAPLPGFTMPPAWTPTPKPTSLSVPGWETFSGNQIELMLPPAYEGGDPALLGEELADAIDDAPEYADLAQAIRDDPYGYRLLALDRETGSIVAVTAHDVPSEVSMAEYVDKFSAAAVEQTPGITLIQKGVIPFREGEAGWILFEFTLGEAVSWQLTYAVRNGDQVWNLNYGAVREDYPGLHPTFDQSFHTLEFTP